MYILAAGIALLHRCVAPFGDPIVDGNAAAGAQEPVVNAPSTEPNVVPASISPIPTPLTETDSSSDNESAPSSKAEQPEKTGVGREALKLELESIIAFKEALGNYVKAEQRKASRELSEPDMTGTNVNLDATLTDTTFILNQAASNLSPAVAAKLAVQMGPVDSLLDRFTIKLGPTANYHSYVGRILLVDPLTQPAEEWVAKLNFARDKFKAQPVVGMDLEFGDSRARAQGREPYVAMIQLALPDLVFLLRTPRKEQPPWNDARNGLPKWVRKFISSEGVVKVTVGSASGDIIKLKSSFGLDVPPSSIFELQDQIAHDVEPSKVANFVEVCRHFGYKPLKHDDDDADGAAEQKFSWGLPIPVPADKIKYAAEDAFFPLVVYAEMQDVLGRRLVRDHLLAELAPSLSGPVVERSADNYLSPKSVNAKTVQSANFKISNCDKLLASVKNDLIEQNLIIYRGKDSPKDGCNFEFCLKGFEDNCRMHTLKLRWLGKGVVPAELNEIQESLTQFVRNSLGEEHLASPGSLRTPGRPSKRKYDRGERV